MYDLFKKLVVALLIYLIGGFPTLVFAMPKGGQIVAGQGSINQPTANDMVINQSTARMITNWQGFSIGAPESVQFNQPGADSVALNRVIGIDPSVILGKLSANGQIFLTNPSGVIFGKSAVVNVGGLLATTLKISDQDFLNRNYKFTRDPDRPLSSILNEGRITASSGGYVGLLAPEVENRGTITANLGSVALASGNAATLDFSGDGLINFSITEPSECDSCGVTNSGLIQADGGQVILSARAAGNLIRSVVNNTGIIQANTVVEKEGKIFLIGGEKGVVENSGTLDASGDDAGEKGGTIHMLGEKVGLFDNAKVDVSGDTGGGTALIGGDFQGKNLAIQNAFRTYVSNDATINSNAETTGDGGKVIVWADDTTRFYGNINARGGSQSGNGGFVEVSGKRNLVFDGEVDTTAINGQTGSLLLDPDDIIIADGTGATNDGEIGASDGTIAFADGSGTYTISEQALEGISSTTDITLQANNSILMNDLTDNELTLDQTGSVQFLAGAGGFSMTWSDEINLTGGASLTIDTIGNSSGGTGDGAITVGSLTTTGAGGITLNGTSVAMDGNYYSLLGTGMTTITATTGDIDLNGGSFTAGGAITMNAPNGNIDLGELYYGDFSSGGDMILTAGNNFWIDLEYDNFISGGEVNITATKGSVFIDIDDGFFSSASNVDLDAGTYIFIEHHFGDFTSGGSLSLTANDSIEFELYGWSDNNNISAAGPISIIADDDGDGYGDFILDSPLSTIDQLISITAADLVMDTTNGSINSGSGNMSIEVSAEDRDIALGDATSGMTIDNSELLNIFAQNLNIGGDNTYYLYVDNVDLISNIPGTVTLTATNAAAGYDDGMVRFINNPFASNALSVNAYDGIDLYTDVTTYGNMIFNADANGSGSGDFLLASGVSLSTNGNWLGIEANDVDLQGSIDVGGGYMGIYVSDGEDIGIGDAHCGEPCGMTIDGTEMNNISDMAGLDIGDSNTGSIFFDNSTGWLDPENNRDITEMTLTLNALGSSDITFDGQPTTFGSLYLKANDDITINADITTTNGVFDAVANYDNNNSGDFTLARGITITSAEDINITANNIINDGTLNPGDGSLNQTETSGNGGDGDDDNGGDGDVGDDTTDDTTTETVTVTETTTTGQQQELDQANQSTFVIEFFENAGANCAV